MVDYQIDGIELYVILEMLDVFNEDLSNKEDSQFHLIMTVAKEFAECVLCISMKHTDRIEVDDLVHAYV
jgi:hypothetical protein